MYTYLWVKCSEDLKNRNKGQLSCGLNFYTLTKRDTESEAKAEHSDNNNHNWQLLLVCECVKNGPKHKAGHKESLE